MDMTFPGVGGSAAIPRLDFDRRAPIEGFEILPLQELRARRERLGHTERVHRGTFHSISFVTGGRGHRVVDFVDHSCTPGTLLWVRPGQVQQYGAGDTDEGWHLIFTADFVAPLPQLHALLDDWAPTVCRHVAPGEPFDVLVAFCALLLREQAADARSPSVEVVRLAFGALLAAIHRDEPSASTDTVRNETYAHFRALLEQRFRTDRSVASYARLLGYSSRTLTRACIDATGRPAKTLIDERVALEARRLLVHGTDGVAEIARSLGFDEATNFVKFFRRHVHSSPRAFRRTAGPAPAGSATS